MRRRQGSGDLAGRARQELHQAIRDGWVHRPETCEQCGKHEPIEYIGGVQVSNSKIYGYIQNPARPFDVRWLCGDCYPWPPGSTRYREMIMATFHSWLTGHETGPSDDPVAWLARQWKACEGNRPKVSSPTGIEKHLLRTPEQSGAAVGISAEQWTAGVRDSVAAATDRYRADKAREQAGLPATSSGETTAPAGDTNPATGKPVAVVGSRSWIEHPLASKFGTCETCGWPIGVADASKVHPAGSGKVLTCAAGHYINQATGETIGGAVQPAQVYDPEHDAPFEQAAQMQAEAAQLDRIELMLAAICATLGLPGDNPDALAGLIAAAAETDRGDPGEGLLSQQLSNGAQDDTPRQMDAAGDVLSIRTGDFTPADFASWYDMADPAAQGGDDG